MATLFQDDFAAGLSGTNWSQDTGDSWAAASGIMGPTSATQGPATIRTTTAAHAAVADVKVSVKMIQAAGDGGPIARVGGGTQSSSVSGNNAQFYALDIYPTNRCELYRYDPGVGSVLIGSFTATQVANGVASIEVTGSGATVAVKAFYQGVQAGSTVNDGDANRITAAGQTGIHVFSPFGGSNNDADDFLVEDFVVSSLKQEGFRFRNDDGSETTATWKAAQDTDISAADGTTMRLRVVVDTTGDTPQGRPMLQYRKVGDADWKTVM